MFPSHGYAMPRTDDIGRYRPPPDYWPVCPTCDHRVDPTDEQRRCDAVFTNRGCGVRACRRGCAVGGA